VVRTGLHREGDAHGINGGWNGFANTLHFPDAGQPPGNIRRWEGADEQENSGRGFLRMSIEGNAGLSH